MTLSSALKRIKASEGLVITQRIDQWLVDHPEGIVVPDWLMPTAQRLLTDDSNSQRQARFGASSRGSCQRHQLFAFLGMPATIQYDPQLMNIFGDGTFRHIRWQLMGMLAGVFTDVEVQAHLPAYNLKTSLDAENDDEDFFFELKGTNAFSTVVENGPSERHLKQIHTCFLARPDYSKCVFVAEDKRVQQWQEIIIRPNKLMMREVKDELNAMNDALEDERLPHMIPECVRKKGDVFHQCPFKLTCPSQDTWPQGRTWDE